MPCWACTYVAARVHQSSLGGAKAVALLLGIYQNISKSECPHAWRMLPALAQKYATSSEKGQLPCTMSNHSELPAEVNPELMSPSSLRLQGHPHIRPATRCVLLETGAFRARRPSTNSTRHLTAAQAQMGVACVVLSTPSAPLSHTHTHPPTRLRTRRFRRCTSSRALMFPCSSSSTPSHVLSNPFSQAYPAPAFSS